MSNIYSVNLNGSSAFSISDHADFHPTTAYTFGKWIKTNQTTDTQFFTDYSNYNSDPNHGIFIDLNTGSTSGRIRLIHGIGVTTQSSIWDGSGINDGSWHWLVISWNGTTATCYFDASQYGSANVMAAPAWAATNYIRIGCFQNDGNNDFLTGNLDEFFFINGTAWDSTTVTSYYKKYITGATDLKAYYQFENNGNDSSGNSHTLTAIGSPSYQTNVPFNIDSSTFSYRTLLGVGI